MDFNNLVICTDQFAKGSSLNAITKCKEGVTPMSYEIRIEKNPNPKPKPDQTALGFGQIFTDHMFIMNYTEGKGWHDPRIVPYGPLPMDPSVMVFHYGQATFEGLKAYKAKDGRILLFRPYANIDRINASNERLCIPEIDREFGVKPLRPW
jgi:branched-chain amino acid aminotransferase